MEKSWLDVQLFKRNGALTIANGPGHQGTKPRRKPRGDSPKQGRVLSHDGTGNPSRRVSWPAVNGERLQSGCLPASARSVQELLTGGAGFDLDPA